MDVGFRLAERDKRVAAGVLAGGIAYRIFFWFLSVALVVIGALGLGDSTRVQSVLRDAGVGSSLTTAVDDVAEQSQAVDWSLLVVGSWLVLWTGYMAAKALLLVHATVWGVPPPPLANALKASLAFTGAAVGFIASMAAARWLRAEEATPGLIATLALIVIPFALWLAVSQRLPHRDVGWRELVPGALLVAAGAQALHLFTTLFLGPRLTNATELYGALGIATTILFWFYLVGRLVLAGAMLNASLDDQRSGAEQA